MGSGLGATLATPYRRPRRSHRGSTILPIPSAPGTPSSPSPANGGTALYSLLSWTATGATKFDVYFGTNPSPPLLISHYVGAMYTPTLTPSTTYYWQIVAINDGGSTAGPVWSFTTPSASTVLFLLDGALMTSRVRFPSGLSIRDVLGAQPNTGDMLFDTSPPTAGQAITIGLGSLDPGRLLFGGEIQFLDESYELKPDLEIWPANIIDHTFALNKRRPFGTFVNVSVTTIAQTLVAQYAPGFSAAGIETGLDLLSINFDGSQDFMSCLNQLAVAINGRAQVDYSRVVKLFVTDTEAAPDPIDTSHPCLNNPPIRFSMDLSQVRTRVYGKGHGEKLLSDVNLGEWILPIADGVMFNATGGKVIVGTTAEGAQTQILTYDGVQLGGRGSLVGPGASPSSSPAGTIQDGAGSVDAGLHDYAVTFVTASGESLPGPRSHVTMMSRPAASTAVLVDVNAGDMSVGDQVQYVTTYTNANGETQISALSNLIVIGLGGNGLPNGARVNTPALSSFATGGRMWRSRNGIWDRYAIMNVFWWSPGTFSDNGLNWTASGSFTPPLNPRNQMGLSSISIGQAAVTSRKVYRSPVGSSQLKLLTTLGDNSTTIYADTTADASLGANAPTIDNSGLSQPNGQVLAGETSLLTAGTSPFSDSGGWAVIGNGQQVIRYTGTTGGSLTGIPASGPGAIVASVSYNSTVTAAPALTGINANNGIPVALAKGSKVAIWVQRDDLTAQAALGQLERNPDGAPGDGIREYTITDERRTEASMIDLCDADLARFSRPIVGVSYHCRDPKSKAGKTVHIDQHTGAMFNPAKFNPAVFNTGTTWGLAGDFLIQDVTITFDPAPSLLPRYAVRASSAKFSFEDLLQRVLVTT